MPSEAKNTGNEKDLQSAIELRHFRAFTAVVETGSFSSAARRLSTTQPTISRTIASLERLVGARLMRRDSRTIRLTDRGRAFARHAHQVLDAFDVLTRELHKSTEEIRIGVIATAGLKRLVAIADQKMRIADVPVVISESTLADGFRPILLGEVDAMLVPMPITPLADFHHIAIDTSFPAVMALSDHPIAARGTCTMSDLLEDPILVPPADPIWQESFETLMRAHLSKRPRYQPTSSLYDACNRVALGQGIAISFSGENFPTIEGCVTVPVSDLPPVSIALVWTDRTAEAVAHIVRELEPAD